MIRKSFLVQMDFKLVWREGSGIKRAARQRKNMTKGGKCRNLSKD